jgi:hypothetical protein
MKSTANTIRPNVINAGIIGLFQCVQCGGSEIRSSLTARALSEFLNQTTPEF